MSAREFLDRLEKDSLLETAVIADLRRQLSEASRGVTAESIAKLLVDNGHLTRFQATKLVNEVTAEIEQRKGQQAESKETRRAEADKKKTGKAPAAEDELLLAPMPGEPAQPARPPVPSRSAASAGAAAASASRSAGKAAAPPPKPTAAPADDELILGDAPDPTRTAKPAKPKPPPTAAAPKPPKERPPKTAPTITEEDLFAENGDLDPLAPAAPAKASRSERKRNKESKPVEVLEPLDAPAAAAPAADEIPSELAAALLAKKKRVRDNPWDSPLMLVGGGVLVLLAVLLFVLYRSMTRGTAQEIFAAAEDDYRNASYTNAIDKYETMLGSFPYDKDAGKARVKKEMARLHLVADGARNPEKALAAAQEILPPLKEEPDFQIVREELASLLPDIALSFATRAQKAESVDEAEKLLGSVNSAMELVNDPAYIPTSLRKSLTGVISRVEETAAVVRRDIGRNRELANAVKTMREAIDSRQPQEAYQVRDALVAKYPVLEQHPQIVETITAISDLQRDLVQVNQQAVEGIADDAVAKGDSVVVYSRAGGGVPGITDQTVAVLAQGSVYGVDVASGQVLWRRFVGHDTLVYPQPLSKEPDADILVTKAADNEVMRLDARTGEVVWRLPIGEAFYQPVVWRDRVLVTTRSGFVWSIDATGGGSSRQTNLGQELPVSVGADTRVAQLYQIGRNDNLYVLSPESMECREVYYMGHRPGTIVVPPTPAVGRLFVAVNAGADYSLVHCLAMDNEGLKLAPAQDPLRLDGHIVTPPVQVGRRLIYTTTKGAVHVFDINPDANPSVVEDIKPLPGTRSSAVASFAMAEQGKLWVADERLVMYDVQASQGQLARRWIEYDGDTFVGPLQRVGSALIHVRRAANAPGFRITAVDNENAKTVYWQTDVAAPVLEMFAVDGGVAAITARGGVVRATSEALQQGILEAAGNDQAGNLVFDAAVALNGGRYAIFSSAGRAMVYDPASANGGMRLLRLNIPERAATTAPLAFADGLLVPLSNGQITLLDLTTGDNKVLPFHPAVEAGSTVNWRLPAVLAEGKEFVVNDGKTRAYRVGIVETGRPHLEQFESVPLDEEPITGFAVLGQLAWMGVRRGDQDVLLSVTLPRLEAGSEVALQGRIVWGPQLVGDAIFVATDAEGLVAITEAGERRWATAIPEGVPAGIRQDGADFVLTTSGGQVLRIAGADGQIMAEHQVGEPLASPPIRAGNEWWVATFDGTLHRIEELRATEN